MSKTQFTTSSMYSGIMAHGVTASLIFGSLPSMGPYQPFHVNDPLTPSLINFIHSSMGLTLPSIAGQPSVNGKRSSLCPPDEDIEPRISHLEIEDVTCQQLWRAFKDEAGPWRSYRFDMPYWDIPIFKSKDTPDDTALEGFDGILTKKIIAPSLSRVDRSPEFQRYAYTKCVLTNKKLINIDLLANYQYLQYIDVSSNKLTTLKPLGGLPFLKVLDASHNCLNAILDFKAPFFLTVVDLSHNKIRSMRDLSEFWSITDLNLSYNLINMIDGLQELKYLFLLNMSHNRIKTLENLSGLRVQFLYLQNNDITVNEDDVKAELFTLKYIRIINLSFNQVNSLKVFERVENLEFLDIVHNNICKLLDVYYLRNLKYLSTLNLTGNPVTTFGRYIEVCVTHIKNLTLLDNEPLNSDYWLERLSNQSLDISQVAAHNRLKLTVLEQLRPPQLWSWLPPYDCPPMAAIVLVGLQASKRASIAREFCAANKNVVVGIPYTTKPKYLNEVEGEHFYYCDNNTFKTMLKNGEFLTYQEVLGSYFGIPHTEFKKAKNAFVMFYTDLTTALSIRRRFLNTVLVLALPSTREAHLERLNILYAVQVFEDGTMKILNSPVMAAQCQMEYDEDPKILSGQAKEIIEDLVKKACELDDTTEISSDMKCSEDVSVCTRKSEKSEILQLWISSSQSANNQSGSTYVQTSSDPTGPEALRQQQKDEASQMKRYVSFTVAHVHKIYNSDAELSMISTDVPKSDTKQESKEEKVIQTYPIRPSLEVSKTSLSKRIEPTQQAASEVLAGIAKTSCPLEGKGVQSMGKCFTEILSEDPRIKSIFNEELRKRDELLELHLDMPGLFRELLFTDHEEDTMNKLKNLVKEITKYNETTKNAVLSFEKDEVYQDIVKNRVRNCFTELAKDSSTSQKHAGYYRETIEDRCQSRRCNNPNCVQWQNI